MDGGLIANPVLTVDLVMDYLVGVEHGPGCSFTVDASTAAFTAAHSKGC